MGRTKPATEQTLVYEVTEQIRGRVKDSANSEEFARVIGDVVRVKLWDVELDDLWAEYAALIQQYPRGPLAGECAEQFEWPEAPSGWHKQVGKYLTQAVWHKLLVEHARADAKAKKADKTSG